MSASRDSFNGTMRDEVLNGEEFDNVLEARVVIGFGVNGKNTFSAKVTARDSFAGSVAWFQMQTANGWRRIALVVINQFSVAKFHVTLKKGHTYTLRIYLPQSQAGPGYLSGTSHTERVVGTK
ncbi:MAG: integrase core domain-containing protein [Gaiellaceae bacterium]